MNWLWGIVGTVGGVLALRVFFALRATRRVVASLNRHMQTVTQ
jgi:hypothetical protein